RQLPGTASDFTDHAISQQSHARRAERLVLALDRLFTALPITATTKDASADLDALFRAVQSLPDFDAAQFSVRLRNFAAALGDAPFTIGVQWISPHASRDYSALALSRQQSGDHLKTVC